MIGVVFLDFKRAFETINRQLLVLKLKKYGLGQIILKWFDDYLSNRVQVTKYGETSKPRKTVYGVPQGTVLGPTLFILYINDLVKIVQKCKIQLFADDTVIYVMGNNAQEIQDTLNFEINKVYEWLNNNCLQLNITKTKSMLIRNCRLNITINLNVKINNVMIEKVHKFKYLGCIIDENLAFSDHCKYITNKIAKKVNLLGRMSKTLSPWAKLIIYKTIIAPHFYFCSTLLFLINRAEMEELQKTQNKALRIILNCNRYTRRTDMLNCTGLLSVRQTIMCNTLIFIYKILNQLVPKNLLDKCKFVREVHEHNTRSRNNFYLAKMNNNYHQNNIFHKGLKQYNELPECIKNSKTLSEFRRDCRQYVKEIVPI